MAAKKPATTTKRKTGPKKGQKLTVNQKRRRVLLANATRMRNKMAHLTPGAAGFQHNSVHSELLSRFVAQSGTRKFDSPHELVLAAQEYFDWALGNPLYEAKLTTYEGDSVIESVPHARIFSKSAMCMYIGISKEGFDKMREREGWTEACRAIEEAIVCQKKEGAHAGFFNASLLALELGFRNRDNPPPAPDGEAQPDESVVPVFNVRPAAAEVTVTRGKAKQAQQ